MFPRLLLPGLVSTLAAVMPLTAADPAPDTEAYFTRFVQPVLESTCVHCHNADQQKGDGRLDTLENALKGGENGAWLVPGKPEESKLYTSTRLPADDDMVMPPSKEPALTAVQSDHLKAWITAGAKWPAGLTLATQPRMQFVRDIQPILEQNCVSCHRPDKLKGDLDMTTLAATIKGGENGTSLVAFDPDASPLYTHTTLKEDDEELMPPVKSGGPLKAEQQEKLKRWVQQGAPWPEGVVLVPKTKTEDRPPSPDTIELTGKVRELIVAGSKEASADQLKAYQETVKKTGKEFAMVPIPGGEFLMGSPETEKDRKPDEGPQVKVKIEPFWMGATEVTWDLYMPFMVTPDARWKDGSKKTLNPKDEPVDATSSPTAPYTDMTFGMGQDGYPAISMTEHAANKFCQWLSAQTGHFYRLPTEAEWEYAARAGTTTAWSFGDDASKIGDYAWYFENSDGKTQQVAQKKPNPWGLYDIHGNAAEWTLDQYDPAYYGAMAALVQTGAAPLPWNKPVTLYPRSVRGGSWDDYLKDLRSAARRGSKDTWKVMDPQLPKSIWYHTSAQFLGMRLVRPLRVPSVEEMHDAWNLGTKNVVK
jgi:formylglycine-generating enzyme required for sulfatase activity/mono/diheme cytochrome c family protein